MNSNNIDKLAELFKKFPGIGERQARRFVYFLLHQNPNYLSELVSLIQGIKKSVNQCKSCYVFFQDDDEVKECAICRDPNTDQATLMIVEKDADYDNIHESHFYKGKYFILGGLVPIVEKNTGKLVRINELLKKIEKEKPREVVLALSLSPQGEHTDTYLRQLLSPLSEKLGLKISSLGRGLSTGLELEYSDPETLKNALKNRS
ncbi:MAG TPA: toprim domain-containing protein [Candidatus Paceibacterota bacterium]